MKVFFRPEQCAGNPKSFSPSAAKPASVVADWIKQGLIEWSDVLSFEPVSRDDLKRAHEADYVDAVLDLRTTNGFGNADPDVAASLPYTNGSMLAAARYALAHQQNVCSPTSGFHHAHFARGGAYCTFNGLMVTALTLLEQGAVKSVGIIDCDAHYGDGTANIIATRKARGVRHHTMGDEFHSRSDAGANGQRFFSWLDRAIADCQEVDLVIYQAGADPHVNDPLGGILSTDEMKQRDLAVFKAFQGRALVWNLAGGYQRDVNGDITPVLVLHRNTALAQRVYQP